MFLPYQGNRYPSLIMPPKMRKSNSQKETVIWHIHYLKFSRACITLMPSMQHSGGECGYVTAVDVHQP